MGKIGSGVEDAVTTVINEFVKQGSEVGTLTGATSVTGFIEDIKRAKNSDDSNALLKLFGTLAAVYVAGEVLKEVEQKKALKDGSK